MKLSKKIDMYATSKHRTVENMLEPLHFESHAATELREPRQRQTKEGLLDDQMESIS